MSEDQAKCIRNGWKVGDILEGDEGFGPSQIRLNYIGPHVLIAQQILQNGKPVECRESTWTLSWRDWRKVEPPHG